MKHYNLCTVGDIIKLEGKQQHLVAPEIQWTAHKCQLPFCKF